jgi:glutamate synthase (NADPH) large chain
LVGRTDLLTTKESSDSVYGKLDLSGIIKNPYIGTNEKFIFDPKQIYNFELEKTLDEKVLLKQLEKAMNQNQKRSLEIEVGNTDRAFGTILGSEITKRFGDTLDEDTYTYFVKVQVDKVLVHSFQKD